MTTTDDLCKEISANFSGDIATDSETLGKHSRDASIFQVQPQVVVFPKTTTDVESLVKSVRTLREKGESVALAPRAAGTDMSGGPLTNSIAVSFMKYFTHYDVGEGFATVEPGVYYRDLEKATLEKNWIMPSYPASKDLCALGGMIADNAAGELTLKYGKVADYVEALEVVLDDGTVATFGEVSMAELEEKKKLTTREGEIYRALHALIEQNYDAIMAAKPNVSKNSSGYALWDVWNKEKGTFNVARLITGSQGTLGFVTSARMRLVRPQPHTALVVMFMRTLDLLPEIVNRLRPLQPQAIETFDDQTLKIAMRFAPEIIKKMKGSFIPLMFSFMPEVKMALMGGLPKLIILAEFSADSDEAAQAQARQAHAVLADLNIQTRIATPQDAEKYWTIRRKSFDLLRKHYQGLRASAFVDDIVVRPEHLPAFLPEMRAILDKYDIVNTVAGHVGDGNFHIIPLVDFSKPDTPQMIRALTEEMYALVKKYKGSISGEHNDGFIRTGYLSYMFDDRTLGLFAETKKIFDPLNIFNPGKKVNMTPDEAFTHLIKWEPKK